ncbi:MAG: hypothetical protein UT28_C0001G0177 [Berkelbacteria bacterium GW2011_GWE1_39_12]|uniref:Uncharacterized protein n=1 Tax=Berkelbacteria bacterium GW2011_GWE1_39_12 TaxID=1618337 RepID=A0A0G4B3J4_9BACT|nr:MAG: hypothetical protein UT28_C0001G0177 [Berkelbacteria bacterium GW2011_GWE1_39_12]
MFFKDYLLLVIPTPINTVPIVVPITIPIHNAVAMARIAVVVLSMQLKTLVVSVPIESVMTLVTAREIVAVMC